MKKIISLLSAVALLVTMLSTVAFADGGVSLSLVEKEKTATSVTYNVVKAGDSTSLYNFKYDFETLLNAGVVFTCEMASNASDIGLTAMNVNTKTKPATNHGRFVISGTGTLPEGEVVLGTIKFDYSAVDGTIEFTAGENVGTTKLATDNINGMKFTNKKEEPVVEKVKKGETFDAIEDEAIEALAGEDTLTFVDVTEAANADKYIEITNSKEESKKSLQTIGELLGVKGIGEITGKIFIYVKGAADTYTAAYVD